MQTPKRTERSRKLILDAADAAFRETGIPNVSMEEIAQRAGLTRKTLYNLFSSKEEIAHQLVIRVEAQGVAIYHPRIEAGESVISLLAEVFGSSARWCLANPSLARLALAGPEKPTGVPPADRPSFHALVVDLMRLGQHQKAVRTDVDPNTMALLLLGAYAQTMLFALAGGPLREDAIPRLIQLMIEGFGPRKKSAPIKTRSRNA
ncbi:TetR/AcrR family transcriptional regulator [Methylocystis parvus]|uniref:TetR/AcrR family transcriptional regulator n=1 Tax=Methylocystis parvus TaxID=134 RepID=A0A6B8MD39_9HYPH|nr:TetR/AcrR family transcriptional regulator [Methylocystis parvus]QGM99539.1 TetR/AcrR family transcriptional regulator [Methylocystis parvus]